MNKNLLGFLVIFFILVLIAVGMIITIYGDNVRNTDAGYYDLTILSTYDHDSLMMHLEARDILKNPKTFIWVSERMNYPKTIEAGKFQIPNNISNRALIGQLRNGYMEKAVKLTLTNINSRSELYESVAQTLETRVEDLKSIFESDSFARSNNYTLDNVWGMVMPDTYEFFWDTDAAGFFDRMKKEYAAFWTDERKGLAASKNLTPMDCIVLASIVEKESNKPDEYDRIAGVYVNRVMKNWPLQADPTLKFALGKPELRRVLDEHKEVDSPYNTYKYPGVPPGPICLPQKTTVNAVLSAEDHDFMYFCAKDDFSGYHVFAKTLREHNSNAKKYHNALNKSGIF